jgi:hypothetical protein
MTKKFGHMTRIGDIRSAMLERASGLFGSRNRTAVLVAIRLLEETYAKELTELLGLHLFSVQSILRSLEGEGVILGRTMGRTRIIHLNPRYFAQAELSALLWKLGVHDVALQRQLAARRRRPRRSGKPGLP